MNQVNEKIIEDIVRKVMAEQLTGKKEALVKSVDRSGVLSVKGSSVKCERFDTGKAGDQVYLTDIVTLEESPRLGCGFMEMTETTFDWTLQYDEVDYIIEGTLEIVIDGRKVTGNQGDVIMIPKGTAIQFSVPKYAKFMYVTYPANWAETVKGDTAE